jgi:hypothetical protein
VARAAPGRPVGAFGKPPALASWRFSFPRCKMSTSDVPAPRVTRSATRRLALGSLQPVADGTAPEVTSRKRAPPSDPAAECILRRAKAQTPMVPPAAEPECTICFEMLGTAGGKQPLSTCSHVFCRECLSTHCARQRRYDLPCSCPLCKQELSEVDVEQCGPPKPLQEESEHEDEGVMILVEFEGDDGENGCVPYSRGHSLEPQAEDAHTQSHAHAVGMIDGIYSSLPVSRAALQELLGIAR